LKLAIGLDELDARVHEPLEQVHDDLQVLFGQTRGQVVLDVGVFEWTPAEL
jgi:hypothetical protein